jgi:hypothetical protein
MDEKMTWMPTWQHSLLGEFSESQVFGQPRTLNKKLGLYKIPTWTLLLLLFVHLAHLKGHVRL